MIFWLITISGGSIFWLLTDMTSSSGFRNLFSPFMCAIFVLIAVFKIAVYLYDGKGGGGFGDGGFGDGGNCGGGDGGCE